MSHPPSNPTELIPADIYDLQVGTTIYIRGRQPAIITKLDLPLIHWCWIVGTGDSNNNNMPQLSTRELHRSFNTRPNIFYIQPYHNINNRMHAVDTPYNYTNTDIKLTQSSGSDNEEEEEGDDNKDEFHVIQHNNNNIINHTNDDDVLFDTNIVQSQSNTDNTDDSMQSTHPDAPTLHTARPGSH